jgi:hypothetical protein
MRILWTLLKVIVALAIAIPVGILALALTVGIVGTLVGLAVMTLKLLCLGLVGYGVYRLARVMFGSPTRIPPAPVRPIAAPDPYYESAMRELNAELRE